MWHYRNDSWGAGPALEVNNLTNSLILHTPFSQCGVFRLSNNIVEAVLACHAEAMGCC